MFLFNDYNHINLILIRIVVSSSKKKNRNWRVTTKVYPWVADPFLECLVTISRPWKTQLWYELSKTQLFIYYGSVIYVHCLNAQAPPLEAKLKISWPNLEIPNNTKFWELEWNGHGKCSEQTFTQSQFFGLAHEMWIKNNITDILQTANIVSGKQESYAGIEGPIKSSTKKTPLLRCLKPQNTQRLHEVVVCWDHGGKSMIDCNITEATCDNNYLIDVQ